MPQTHKHKEYLELIASEINKRLPAKMAPTILKALQNPEITATLTDEELLGLRAVIVYLKRESTPETKELYASVWGLEDIKSMAESEGCYEGELPDEIARKTLVRAINTHDSGVGINWDSLQCDLEDVIAEE